MQSVSTRIDECFSYKYLLEKILYSENTGQNCHFDFASPGIKKKKNMS